MPHRLTPKVGHPHYLKNVQENIIIKFNLHGLTIKAFHWLKISQDSVAVIHNQQNIHTCTRHIKLFNNKLQRKRTPNKYLHGYIRKKS